MTETRIEHDVRSVSEPGWDAVLLAGFGGPEAPADVMPFLRNVTRGRGIPEERLIEVSHHYEALGGASPINEQNRLLRAALQEELARRGIDLPVLWGNRNWAPYLTDIVRQAHRDGQPRLLGLATSAYSSYSSCRQYREDFGRALVDADLVGKVRIDKLRVYFNLPGFLDPFIDGVTDALRAASAAGVPTADLRVVFTTHSIPLTMAQTSGPAASYGPGNLGAYVTQHHAACREVIEQVQRRVDTTIGWELAYQSRSGPPQMPWLEPDINDVIDALPGRGIRGVVVVPIGFVSDHVEVIWDLDNEAKETAEKHHLFFSRVATPGTDPRFVSAMADLVAERLDPSRAKPAITELGPAPDRCAAGCCRNLRGVKPTTGAVDSADDWADLDVDPAALRASGISGRAAPE